MYKLIFGKTFRGDVKSSVDYIKHTLQAPVAAERLKDEIKITYKNIKDTPFIYPVVPNEYLASYRLERREENPNVGGLNGSTVALE